MIVGLQHGRGQVSSLPFHSWRAEGGLAQPMHHVRTSKWPSMKWWSLLRGSRLCFMCTKNIATTEVNKLIHFYLLSEDMSFHCTSYKEIKDGRRSIHGNSLFIKKQTLLIDKCFYFPQGRRTKRPCPCVFVSTIAPTCVAKYTFNGHPLC